MKPILPGVKWLRDNDLSGLAAAMKARPELFSRLEQEQLRRTPHEWRKWLLQRYPDKKLPKMLELPAGVRGAIELHRELFRDFRRSNHGEKTAEEWREWLLKRYPNKQLPPHGTLPVGCQLAISKHRDTIFAQFKRPYDNRRSPSKWREWLMKKYPNKKLPPCSALPNPLLRHMSVHKHLFKDFIRYSDWSK